MRVLSVCAAALAIAAATSAGAASRDIESSWGKPGVSLYDYHADASICADAALKLDVAPHPATKRLIKASRVLDAAYGSVWMSSPAANGSQLFGSAGADTKSVRDAFRVDQSLDQIRDMQLQVLHGCLKGLGYKQFTLTGEQRARLKKLAQRSQQRRAYLHSLASDPAILARQGL
jgi:hypothetical protein